MSFFSHTINNRLGKTNRLSKLHHLLDWSKISEILEKLHEGKRREVGGVIPYNYLSMYKALLLQAWHNLSDPGLEEALRVRIDFMEFTGFYLEDHVPDETTFCRFRSRLVELKLDQVLFEEINRQLSSFGLVIEKSNGAILDATIIESAARPKRQMEISNDREEEKAFQNITLQESCDTDAKWLKKGKRFFFGYKVFSTVQEKKGFIEQLSVTPANQSEMTYFPKMMDKLKPISNRRLYADKGFCSRENRACLKKLKYRNGIMEKATKSHPLRMVQKLKNKWISKRRFIVEQSYGTLKRIFKFRRASYMGIKKVEAEAYRKASCFNLLKAINQMVL